MRTPRLRLPCFLGLVLALGACERQAANPSEPIASTTPRVSPATTRAGRPAPSAHTVQSLTELLRTKSETEDLTPFGGAERIDAEIQRLAKEQLRLELDGVARPATHVYVCRELSGPNGWRCVSGVTHADDTIHTTEFDHEVASARSNKARFVDSSGKSVADLFKVGAGEPGRMHGQGYAHVSVLGVDGEGRFDAPLSKEPWLVFAVVRGTEGWFRKYVWVVRSAQ